MSRLRRDGLVESVWREYAEGPPRRYYHLTDSGRTALTMVNQLSPAVIDPNAYTPEFKGFLVKVEKV